MVQQTAFLIGLSPATMPLCWSLCKGVEPYVSTSTVEIEALIGKAPPRALRHGHLLAVNPNFNIPFTLRSEQLKSASHCMLPAAFAVRATFCLLLATWLALTGCTPAEPDPTAPILLFKGTGTSPNDVKAVEVILRNGHLRYATVNSEQLDRLSEAQLRAHQLLIIPGGNYLTIGDHLTTNATTKVRHSVQEGMNYLGICAGGLLAGATGHNSVNLTSGVRFGFYAVVNRGIHKDVVAIAVPGSPVLEHYWEDGPQFTGWGGVAAKYPDGTPAVVQGTAGKGWVVLCGVHPEAPENWRRGLNFTTPTSADHAYALTLIEAALNAQRLPQY